MRAFGALACFLLLACSSTPPPKTEDQAPQKAPEPTIEEPASDDSGTLDISCPREGSVVKIDGKEIGKSPITKKVAPGSHDVTCEDEESGPTTMTIPVGASESKTVDFPKPVPKIQEQQPKTDDKATGKQPKKP